jgi:peptidoglycan/xylan/chitin deacetylase (PgdA/CDA1 family)
MLKKIIAQSVSAIIPFKWLYSRENMPTLNIFYHTVSDDYLPHINPLYTPRTIKQFKKDIDFLCHTTQKANVEFNISFDDGLRETYDIILPILYAKGIPATVFVCSDFVDNRQLFFRHKAALLGELSIRYAERDILDKLAQTRNIDFEEYLKNKKPYLTTEQLKEMQQKGFTVGAHSIDHPLYKELTLQEQIRQTLTSAEFIKNTFNEKNIYLAFPFTEQGVTKEFYEKTKHEITAFFGLKNRINAEYSNTAKEAVYRTLLKRKLWN